MEAQGKRVVFLNFAATGHINPTLPLVAEFTARGWHATYLVEDTMRSVVEAAGARWMPFRNPDDDFTGIPKKLTESGVAKYVPEGTPREEYMDVPSCMVYIVELLLPALIEDLLNLKPRPSLIVYDPFLGCGPVLSRVLGVPAVTVLTMPGPGVLSKPDEVVDMWEAKPWVEGPRQEVLAKYGVDVLKNGMQMEFYSSTLNLVTTINEFFTPPCAGRQQERFGFFPFRCVGVLANPKVKRIQNAHVAEDDTEPLDFGELDSAIKSGRSLVYISLGTVASSEHFWERAFGHFGKRNGLEECTGKVLTQHVFRCCIEGLGDESENAPLVVLSLGPQEDVLEGLPPTPSNFRLRKAVPQLEVLRRCSAFITHCGANSMHEALSLSAPMVAVPIFGDQPSNADRLRDEGVAIAFHQPMESVTSTSIRAAVDQLTRVGAEENTFKAAARKLAKKLEASKSISTAVDALTEVCLPDRHVAAAGA
uniref:UDP-glycosyltransferases domain-containing protein n=1 Tax=Alexandrium catenella TaxID=2925 RepID=A0A7S1S753_ALECA